MRPRFSAFLALTVLILGAGWLVADDQPPQNLRMVGDHWTAWDPPASFPEDTEIYMIQKGDTLWDLSGEFYGDPYLWPQLWERNQYILDAHWIYPGDPLVVGVEVTPIEEISEVGGEGDETLAESGDGSGGLALDRSASAPVPLGSEDDIYCSGFIGSPEEPFAYTVIGSEHSYSSDVKTRSGTTLARGSTSSFFLNLSTGDIIYTDGGRESGLMPGSIFTVVRPEGPVRHPLDDQVVGDFYRYQGRVRILSVQEKSAIAEIVHTCHPIGVGDLLKPFTPEPVPLARRSGLIGVNDPAEKEQLAESPFIILSDEGLFSLGQGHVVYIDRGSQHDVAPGDLFTIYRDTPEGLPPIIVGELAVLSVGEEASLAKILESRYTVHVGDRLDYKPH
jgi:hypothetical protein